MRRAKFFVVAWLLGLLLGAEVRAADFESGNRLYEAGRFAEAQTTYLALVEHGPWTANLFYNLGNTEFRLGHSGAAMLAYERALALEPGHPEARANLRLLRSRTGAMTWPVTWLDAVFFSRWISLQCILGAIALWVMLALLVWIGITPPGDKAGRWFASSIALLFAVYFGIAVWHAERTQMLSVVVADAVEMRTAPAESAATNGVATPGSEVRVLTQRGDWAYCVLPNQQRSWIPSKALEPIRLGGS